MEEVIANLQKKLKTLNRRLDKTYDDIQDTEDLIKEYHDNCDHKFGPEMGSDFDPGDDYHSWIQRYDTWDCLKCGYKKKIKRKIVGQLVDIHNWPATDCQDHRHYPDKYIYILTGSELRYECPTCKIVTVVESPMVNLNE